MVSASGSENVDHVWPTTKRFVWRNACRSLDPAGAGEVGFDEQAHRPFLTRHPKLGAQATRDGRVDGACLVFRSRGSYGDRGGDKPIDGRQHAHERSAQAAERFAQSIRHLTERSTACRLRFDDPPVRRERANAERAHRSNRVALVWSGTIVNRRFARMGVARVSYGTGEIGSTISAACARELY
jgi:hypothetical protein